MRLKAYLGPTLAAFLVCVAFSALAQITPSATESKLPFAVGAGLSGYNSDHGNSHLLGATLWLDYSPTRTPRLLRGIGVEAEARDLNYGRSSSQPNLREDTAEGAVIYSWPHYLNIRPYGKFLMGLGNTDYGNYALDSSCPDSTIANMGGGNADSGSATLCRYHDSRTIAGTGGGVEFRAKHSVWVRIDYEYQFWPNFFKHLMTTQPAGLLNPQGVTVGVMYHFNHPHFH
jgi:opacity protein-like surface antigen